VNYIPAPRGALEIQPELIRKVMSVGKDLIEAPAVCCFYKVLGAAKFAAFQNLYMPRTFLWKFFSAG
jgi:hypothetical protein